MHNSSAERQQEQKRIPGCNMLYLPTASIRSVLQTLSHAFANQALSDTIAKPFSNPLSSSIRHATWSWLEQIASMRSTKVINRTEKWCRAVPNRDPFTVTALVHNYPDLMPFFYSEVSGRHAIPLENQALGTESDMPSQRPPVSCGPCSRKPPMGDFAVYLGRLGVNKWGLINIPSRTPRFDHGELFPCWKCHMFSGFPNGHPM